MPSLMILLVEDHTVPVFGVPTFTAHRSFPEEIGFTVGGLSIIETA